MTARTCTATLTALSPYSASRKLMDVKGPSESWAEFEARIWKKKAHVENGRVFIPPMAFKFALDRAAKMLGQQIPGKGKATYTKFFESGVLVVDNAFIADESALEPEQVYVNTDGVRGSSSRDWRTFPRVSNWTADVTFNVLSVEIPKEVFENTLRQAGTFVGIGRFRPEKGGFFGRFAVTKTKWS